MLLTINGGSSSIKFAIFERQNPPQRILSGELQRVGQPGTVMSATGLGDPVDKQSVEAGDHSEATDKLIDWLETRLCDRTISAIGHRIVHGGFHLAEHCIITAELLDQLKKAADLDPAHLPREIELIESFAKRFANIPQVACFDTAFFRNLPTLSKILPIPRKYFEQGVHRFGFHGLSYTYLMQELRRVAGEDVANGRLILAHLGSGASMAAIKNGRPIDTSMSFTPTAGLVMGTRCGDLDPGVIVYLLRNEKLSVQQLDDLLNKHSGLLGVSGTSADMRDLTARRATDPNAAEAVELFYYQAKKWIGSFAAAMGGVDTIVFAGGIGEHSTDARAGICNDLEFLGIELDRELNFKSEAIISKAKVAVRVMATDEEIVIARTVMDLSKNRPPVIHH